MSDKQTPSQALQKRLEIIAGMISMGEKIAWGSDSALMLEAATMLAAKDAEIATLKSHLADAQELIQKMMVKPDGWLPIETAPKGYESRLFRVNGFCIQGFTDATGVLCAQNDRQSRRKMHGKPTHWMPVPTAPAKPAPAADACLGSPDKP